MKKLILLLLFIPLVSFGQDSILLQKKAYMNKMMELKKDYNTKDRYVIYPTENIYTSLLLDTQTGKIWQLQIGVGDTSALKTVLSDYEYAYTVESAKEKYETAMSIWEEVEDDEKDLWKPDKDFYKDMIGVVGQFKLYPTKNMYNFLMVNTIDGTTWQVQWSNIEEERGVLLFFDK